MRVTFQIPIVDFRCMMPGTNRLPVESYYRERTGMIRNWGTRDDNRANGWVSHHVHCSARNSIKFRFTDPYRVQFKNFGVLTRCTPRRLYQLSEYGCSAEIGFRNLLENHADKKESKKYIEKVIGEYSRVKLGILAITDRNDEAWIEKPAKDVKKRYIEGALADSGKRIAECFLYSSSRTEGVTRRIDKSLIKAGEPVCVAEFFKTKRIGLPEEARLVKGFEQFGFSLYHYNDKSRTSVWLISYNKAKYDRDKAGQLKAGLFRIHAEIECLKHGLQYIDSHWQACSADPDVLAVIQKNLKKLTDKLLREKRFDIAVSEVVAWAFDAVELATPGILSDLRTYAGKLGDAYLSHDIQVITDSVDADYKDGAVRVEALLNSGTFLPGSVEYRSLVELREAFENRWKIRARKLLKGMTEGLPLLIKLLEGLKGLVPQVEIKASLINIDYPADGKPPKAGQSGGS